MLHGGSCWVVENFVIRCRDSEDDNNAVFYRYKHENTNAVLRVHTYHGALGIVLVYPIQSLLL
jgi:hypothetical protein